MKGIKEMKAEQERVEEEEEGEEEASRTESEELRCPVAGRPRNK